MRAAMQYSIHPSWAPTYCLEVPDDPAVDPDGHLVQWEPWVNVRGREGGTPGAVGALGQCEGGGGGGERAGEQGSYSGDLNRRYESRGSSR